MKQSYHHRAVKKTERTKGPDVYVGKHVPSNSTDKKMVAVMVIRSPGAKIPSAGLNFNHGGATMESSFLGTKAHSVMTVPLL